MITSVPTLRSGDADAGSPDPSDHLVIRRRQGLPGSRSVVGGLLVAVAALLTWWAATASSGGPVPRYLAAAQPIGAGERISAHHLAHVEVDLGDELARSAFTSPESLVGAVAVGPIAEGELIQAGSVAQEESPSPERELTFPVVSTWAGGGDLRAGDRIDVYATYGDGTGSQTRRVLTDVRVRRIQAPSGDRLGETRQQTITVGLGSEVPVALVVNAVQSADLTVTRVSGDPTGAAAGEGHDRFDAGADLRPGSGQGEGEDP